jgi:hypothetical protein
LHPIRCIIILMHILFFLGVTDDDSVVVTGWP